MSEQLIHPSEHNTEKHTSHPEHTRQSEVKEHHANSEHKNHHQNVEKLHVRAKSEALSSREVAIGESKENAHSTIGMQRKLKAESYQRTLHKIQSQLKPTEKSFSKFIHHPVVESVSNFSANTIARPSGLLGAGILSFAGSAIVLYYSSYFGFNYNYFVFLGLFAGGFLLGIGIEALNNVFSRKHN